MSRIHLLAPLLICLSAMAADPESDRIANKLVGAWRLVSIKGASPKIPLDFDRPSGLIVYTRSGWVSVQISVKQDRRLFAKGAGQSSPAEAAVAFKEYFSYYGAYKVNAAAQTVTHQLVDSSYPDLRGVDNVRWFELQCEDRIVLTPCEDGQGGVVDRKNATYKLTWERIK